ncbi:uncharacterized protein LA080_008818 [Diaporthe eres]|nr:uncharacterized protein LA080_008818 [Diaporthe eres]
MESPRASKTTRHICGHCQQEVLTAKGCRPFGSAGKTNWRLPLKHDPDAVRQAALSGCPFFVWLWDQLRGSQTPPEQMKRTTIVLELEAKTLKRIPGSDSSGATFSRLTIENSEQETHDITGCVVKAETDSYVWTPGRFIAMSDWDDPSANEAMARMIDGHTSSSQAIAQIRRRLQYCRTHHETCEARPSDIRPTRFISVGKSSAEVKVVPSSNFEDGDTEPYAALSYCWGQARDQSLKSTRANKLEMEKSVPVHLLPKTIQDAIHLTRELHIKLLWVDSLCLMQDDKDELAREVAKMQHYYGNSCLTISVATPASCSDGFLQPEPMPYVSDDEILGPFYFPVDLGDSERPARLKLVTRRSPIEAIDSRAWTLQEGLLSHRLVSFGSRIIRWSCQTESYGPYKIHDLRDAMRAFSSRMWSQPRALWTWGDTKLWCILVENYTARGLSNEGDRLPSISGIGSFIRYQLAVDYCIGLNRRFQWSGRCGVYNSLPIFKLGSLEKSARGPLGTHQSWHFMAQLLWVPLRKASQGKRRGRDQSYIAPSWSWASHNGAVDMTITKIDDSLYRKLTEQKSKCKVWGLTVVPTNPEAAFGSLSRASLTLKCPISRDGKNKHIAFDDGTQHSANNDSSRDSIYLQIIPNIPDLEPKDAVQLRGIPNGLVLKPARHKGQDQTTGHVWRRVGVYYAYESDDEPDDSSVVEERSESSRTALPPPLVCQIIHSSTTTDLGESTRQIHLQDQGNGGWRPFPLHENLWQFLDRTWRSKRFRQLFWTEYLCLDQNGHEEISQQVPRMHAIYRNAELVVIWLQLKQEEQKGLRKAVRWFHPKLKPKVLRRVVKERLFLYRDAIRAAMENPYWRRIWIVQEVVVAKKVCVTTGAMSIDLDDVRFLVDSSIKRRFWKPGPSLWELCDMRAVGGKIPLWRMLRDFGEYQSSRPGDRVFGMLGMVEDREDGSSPVENIQVDYNKPIFHVLLDAMLESSPPLTEYSMTILRLDHEQFLNGFSLLKGCIGEINTTGRHRDFARIALQAFEVFSIIKSARDGHHGDYTPSVLECLFSSVAETDWRPTLRQSAALFGLLL